MEEYNMKRIIIRIIKVLAWAVLAISILLFSLLYYIGIHATPEEPTREGVEADHVQTVIHHYRLPGQKPREWNREIYYGDMDSSTISKWKTMSSKEKVEAIRRSFLFDPDVDWDSHNYEEQERMLLDNAFVEWN